MDKLPEMVLPDYQAVAKFMYTISQNLLDANENLSRWIHRFAYIDFRQQEAKKEFIKALQDFKSMKCGQEYQQLKFSCSEIQSICYQNLADKTGTLF